MRTSRARRRRRMRGVTFCDACGRVCDAACRRRAARDRHLQRALQQGRGW